MELTSTQIAIIEGGAVLYLGTTDRDGRPDLARCSGVRIDDDRRTIRALLPAAWSPPVAANLRDGGWVALSMTNARTYETYQAKGRLLRLEEPTAADREIARAHHPRFVDAILSIGTHESARGYAYEPALAVTFVVEQLYRQTPGPGAGEAVGGGG